MEWSLLDLHTYFIYIHSFLDALGSLWALTCKYEFDFSTLIGSVVTGVRAVSPPLTKFATFWECLLSVRYIYFFLRCINMSFSIRFLSNWQGSIKWDLFFGDQTCWWFRNSRDSLTSWGNSSWNPIVYDGFQHHPWWLALGFLNHQPPAMMTQPWCHRRRQVIRMPIMAVVGAAVVTYTLRCLVDEKFVAMADQRKNQWCELALVSYKRI